MTISLKHTMLGACAALALTACNNAGSDATSDAKSATNAKVAEFSSSLDKPFMLKDGEPLDVDGLLTSMGANDALIYDSSEFDNKSGATVLTNVRLAGEASPFTIGKLELFGVDTDAISALTSGEATGGANDLFRKIRMYDVVASMDDDEAGTGTFKVKALDIDSLAISPITPDPELSEGQQMAKAANAFSVGGMEMQGFAMSAAGFDGVGAVEMVADTFRLGSYKAGSFGGMKMSGVEFDMTQDEAAIGAAAEAMGPVGAALLNSPLKTLVFPESQSGKIGSLSWDGFSIAGLMGYLEKDEKPPLSANDLISIGGLTVLDMTSSINGKLAGSSEKVTVSPIEFEHFMPKSIRSTSEGDSYDLTAYISDEKPELIAILKEKGLDKITGNSKIAYDYSSKNKTIKLVSSGVAKGLANTNFDLDLGNFDYAGMMAEDGPEAALMGVTVNGMTLKIADEQLVETAFTIAGQVMGQDPAALKSMVAGGITMGSIQAGGISPRIPGYAKALSDFVSTGGTLEIKVDPETAANIAQLAASSQMDPGAALETLNLTVTQEAK